MEYTIREIRPDEGHYIKEFTYQAIFQRDRDRLIPRSILDAPEIRVFYEDFGKADDNGLILEVDGNVAGAVWTRVIGGDVKGFGHIDMHTPEFGIGIFEAYRNKGYGTLMMEHMLDTLKKKGYKNTSLAVQKDNYAVKMYEKVGFKIIKELEEEYLMICALSNNG